MVDQKLAGPRRYRICGAPLSARNPFRRCGLVVGHGGAHRPIVEVKAAGLETRSRASALSDAGARDASAVEAARVRVDASR